MVIKAIVFLMKIRKRIKNNPSYNFLKSSLIEI